MKLTPFIIPLSRYYHELYRNLAFHFHLALFTLHLPSQKSIQVFVCVLKDVL